MVRMRMISLLAVLVLCAGSAMAAVVYEAELLVDNVIGGCDCGAYGQATLIVNDEATEASLTLNFAGLQSAQTGSCLLVGAEGEAGTLLMDLELGSPLAMTIAYTPELDAALQADELIIQVYSENCPEGATRGNFVFVTVGVEDHAWSNVKAMFN